MKISKTQDCELQSTAIDGTAPCLCQHRVSYTSLTNTCKFHFVANEMSTPHWIFLVQAVK